MGAHGPLDRRGICLGCGRRECRLVIAGVEADRLTLWSMRAGSWSADTIEENGASISALAYIAIIGVHRGRR